MGAMTLLVDRRGAELKLSKSGEVVYVHYPDGETHRIGLYALRRIIIYGEINLPTSLLRSLEDAEVFQANVFEKNICLKSIILLPQRSKGNTVNLFPYVKTNFQLRQAQYRAYFDKNINLSLARQMAEMKILSQSKWLNYHNLTHDFSDALTQLERAKDNATIMGIEGGVAREYFSKWLRGKSFCEAKTFASKLMGQILAF
jgi:CRISPR/Cas system-associated endonuclease Cas1